jgi:hypothetical protein
VPQYKDGMSVEPALQSIHRDFLPDLATGFVYDVFRDHPATLVMASHRRKVLDHFSGTLCVDELHLGQFALLLATDPIITPSHWSGRTTGTTWSISSGTAEPRPSCDKRSSPTARTCTWPCWTNCYLKLIISVVSSPSSPPSSI